MDLEILKKFFQPNLAYVINTDLDGLLSGMLLQKYCGWKVVGFSMCNGKPQDNLWIDPKYTTDITKVIFVDLYTTAKNYSCIDQHMVAIDDQHVLELQRDHLKLNPNIICGRSLFSNNPQNGYVAKYPFGTVHFIVNCFERIGLIKDNWRIPTGRTTDGFSALDVILRADRVVGNFIQYGPNCKSWAQWLSYGTKDSLPITLSFFSDLLSAPQTHLEQQNAVERKLQQLSCSRGDGECSALIKNFYKNKLEELLSWLADIMQLAKLEIPESIKSYDKLSGYRIGVYNFGGPTNLRENIFKIPGLFSCAIVSSREISITKFK